MKKKQNKCCYANRWLIYWLPMVVEKTIATGEGNAPPMSEIEIRKAHWLKYDQCNARLKREAMLQRLQRLADRMIQVGKEAK